jgi:hypothetical protein
MPCSLKLGADLGIRCAVTEDLGADATHRKLVVAFVQNIAKMQRG